MELAKQDIAEELRTLHATTDEDSHEVKERGRQHIMRKLAKLKPGGTTQIQAIRGEDGRVLTTTEEIAKELATHWAPIFERKAIDQMELQRWLG